jgi:hypothetical protein
MLFNSLAAASVLFFPSTTSARALVPRQFNIDNVVASPALNGEKIKGNPIPLTLWNTYTAEPALIDVDYFQMEQRPDHTFAGRQNCIFYVNKKDSHAGKDAAKAFQALMNALNPGQDYHTLYNVYDVDPFDSSHGPMQEVTENEIERDWFKITSKRFALNCIGKVFLVVEPDQDIFEGAIWLTVSSASLSCDVWLR